jgi:hypothetical protein
MLTNNLSSVSGFGPKRQLFLLPSGCCRECGKARRFRVRLRRNENYRNSGVHFAHWHPCRSDGA